MAIPDYQTLMLPLLKFIADGREKSLRETIEGLAIEFELSEDERKELLPSGQQSTFDNRVGWARTYMKKAGLVSTTRRGYFKITELGQKILSEKPSKIDVPFLRQFDDFIKFQTVKRNRIEKSEKKETADYQTPEEKLENAYDSIRESLASELLQTVKNNSPDFFEQLVIDLLVKMGYGGSKQDAGKAVGKSGDGGIDGIIKEDKLGLDVIYIQAKRWENTVGRPEIQKFAGALQGQRAKKGIFISTSDFTSNAREYAAKIENKIILIDGEHLSQLMIDHNIGVTPVASYELKKIDSDYFTGA